MEKEIVSNINNLLVMGDSIFGTSGHHGIVSEVQKRNRELHELHDTLKAEVEGDDAIIRRSNTDFMYENKKRVKPSMFHVLEDYTLGYLLFTYVFMVFLAITYYTMISPTKIGGFVVAMGYGAMFTMVVGMFLYYLV